MTEVRTLHRNSPLSSILASPEARAIVERLLPELPGKNRTAQWAEFPAGWAIETIMGSGHPGVTKLFDEISGLADPRGPKAVVDVIEPDPGYEGDGVLRASAVVRLPARAGVFVPVEIGFDGPSHGNPFVDVDLRAEFVSDGERIETGGFYDGDGRYAVRFLPPSAGLWRFETRSTARSLDGLTGEINVQASDNPGPVGADGLHFAHANGQTFAPLGTTLYAWTHQTDELIDTTLASLAEAPFNKVRMCVFPKHYDYNTTEPERFPWVRLPDGGFDVTRFDVDYWQRLERRLRELGEMGIQADLILFHPYDKWGFATQADVVDERYLRYLTRRLSCFPHVWWSLANEYDLMLDKSDADWDRIAEVIQSEDPVGHLMSIHNWFRLWDYSSPWATHVSVQYGVDLAGQMLSWRKRWGKPVIVDELGYEGDLPHGWGNLTGEDFVEKCWQIAHTGGYATHGETFWDSDEVVWWSKGGTLRGEAVERLAFLESLRAEAPGGRFDPLPSDFDALTGGAAGEYELTYLGRGRPRSRNVELVAGREARIDIVDTWEMTVTPVGGVHAGVVDVPLPAKPHMGIRVRY